MFYGHFDNSAPFCSFTEEDVSMQHKSQHVILENPKRHDEAQLYVRHVNQRDIKSRIYNANETDPPD